MAAFDLFNQMISIDELQHNAPSVIETVAREQKEKIIIHNNQVQGVLISPDMYDRYVKLLHSNTNPATSQEGSTPLSIHPTHNRKSNRPAFTFDENRSLNDIARDAFDYLEKHQLLTSENIYNLCNGLYCHDIFGLSYPILKPVHNKILLSTEIVVDNQVRYWKQLYTFHGKFYVLYSLLYDKQKMAFIDWLNSILDQN